MDRVELTISFPDETLAAANIAANRLSQYLQPLCSPGDQIDVRRVKGNTQDVGSILVVALGTPAVLAIARGIQSFIAARGNSVEIRTATGHVIARGSGTENIDVAKVVAALTQIRPKSQ